MPSAVVAAPGRARRARYLIPLGTPGRRELLAALAVLGVLGGLLFAPVTLGLAVAFHAVGKITRWRPAWLAVPAACGLIWVLAIGPAAALTGRDQVQMISTSRGLSAVRPPSGDQVPPTAAERWGGTMLTGSELAGSEVAGSEVSVATLAGDATQAEPQTGAAEDTASTATTSALVV